MLCAEMERYLRAVKNKPKKKSFSAVRSDEDHLNVYQGLASAFKTRVHLHWGKKGAAVKLGLWEIFQLPINKHFVAFLVLFSVLYAVYLCDTSV